MSIMWNGLTQFAVGKALALQRRGASRRAEIETRRQTPELLAAYAEFSKGNQSGSPRQPFKGWDLWRILEQSRPRKIVELGSGTTSACFALYARRQGVEYQCFEHSPEWAKVTADSLAKAGLDGEGIQVRTVASRIDEERQCSGFVEQLPNDADFVYIDGPPCPVRNGRKWPNDDIVRLFDSGGRPATIVVDGRISTVDLIRGHAAGGQYEVDLSYVYAFRNGRIGDALRFEEHTVFRLRDA